MNCPKCGRPISENANICPKCKEKIYHNTENNPNYNENGQRKTIPLDNKPIKRNGATARRIILIVVLIILAGAIACVIWNEQIHEYIKDIGCLKWFDKNILWK